MTPSLEALPWKAWQKFCFLIDGMAISSTVFALRQHNILQSLQQDGRSIDFSESTTESEVRWGYFHLAFRLLADQGFVVRNDGNDNRNLHIVSTAKGRNWLSFSSSYDLAMDYLQAAATLTRKKSDLVLPECPLDGLSGVSKLEQQVRLHVVAPLVAAFLVYLFEMQIVKEKSGCFQIGDLGLRKTLSEYCLGLIKDLGWVTLAGDGEWEFTEEGKLLAMFVPQLFYPVSYLKTSIQVPELIFPVAEKKIEAYQEEESHIDRSLDIRFSGLVYKRNFREPIHKILQILFNEKSLAEQPRYIVDTGSGDGTLLFDMYRTIVEKTIRGRFLKEFPLTVVGIEYNRVAEEATANRLSEYEIPFCTFQGDIGQPENIAAALRERGMNLNQVLHISKSVIHNRIYEKVTPCPDLGGWTPRSDGVFIDVDGVLISPLDMAENLVDYFKRWQLLTRGHGMIIIEAHTVQPALIAASVGTNILTSLDSSHGYSHQYLVEKEFFYNAVRVAGYSIQTFMERSVPGVDVAVLTVNYLRNQQL